MCGCAAGLSEGFPIGFANGDLIGNGCVIYFPPIFHILHYELPQTLQRFDECNRLIKSISKKGCIRSAWRAPKACRAGLCFSWMSVGYFFTKAWALRKTQGRRFTGRSARHFTVTEMPNATLSFLSKWRCEKRILRTKEWLLKAALRETTMQ